MIERRRRTERTAVPRPGASPHPDNNEGEGVVGGQVRDEGSAQ